MKKLVFLALVAAGLVACGLWTYPRWSGLIGPETSDKDKASAKHEDHKHEAAKHVHLCPQARANLRLRVEKLVLHRDAYWRTIAVPGQVVERPGSCERVVSAPVAGVVKYIAGIRGEVVHVGQPLFTLELISEHLHSLQADLFKNTREYQIIAQEKKRLEEPFKSGALPIKDMIAVENQLKRVEVAVQARASELEVRGFSTNDLEQVKQGKFLRQLNVSVPAFASGSAHPQGAKETSDSALEGSRQQHAYEVEEIKVMLGEAVQPGQALAVLADHFHLFIEGKVFASEAAWVQQAAHKGLLVQTEFVGENERSWTGTARELKIVNVANRVDPASQTLGFFLELPNQYQEYVRGGKTYRLWRYRPGQRALIQMPVEAFQNVFVVPAEAIVREGPEAFVFRDTEDLEKLERVQVQVLYEDRRIAILAHDGSIRPRDPIAQNGAVQLNWAFKNQTRPDEPHGHDH